MGRRALDVAHEALAVTQVGLAEASTSFLVSHVEIPGWIVPPSSATKMKALGRSLRVLKPVARASRRGLMTSKGSPLVVDSPSHRPLFEPIGSNSLCAKEAPLFLRRISVEYRNSPDSHLSVIV